MHKEEIFDDETDRPNPLQWHREATVEERDMWVETQVRFQAIAYHRITEMTL